MEKTKSSLKSTIAVSLTNYLDAGAIVAGASGLTLWQDYLGLTEGHLGLLNAISANCLGAAIGAIIGGFLADKYGRKAIYTYNMLVYMLGVALIMFSFNFPMLLAGFLVTGISVGVGVPASWTYISENSEVGNRGRNIGISQMAWGIGPTIILILGTLLAPPTGATADSAGVLFAPVVKTLADLLTGGTAEGTALNVFSSRIVFASLFIVAFIAWNLQRRLDESAEWKAEKAKATADGNKGTFASFGSLFTNKVNIRTILFLAGIYLTWNLVSSVMGFFQQHIYETAGGLSNQHANMLSVAQWVIIIITTFFFSMVVDKVNQRWLYAFGVGMGVIAWVIIVTIGVNSIAGLLFFTLIWGIQAGVSVQSFYALWASELFPAKYRAAAQGIMFFIVRGVSALWGLGFVYIYGENGEGFTLAAYIMMALLVISMLIGTIWTPQTRGKTLEQITKERYGDDI
ncbi:MFS transporter [Marseilla massiliensis]|jgi:inositol transporter-like SP family MFS transporter|uniref:MFS transporter n=1 Tax=Marseilla massiliensis TaxID=1841864 RepID=A0A938WSR4_9BACT|nr:MFS transporter [Marseilla massiliensis]MBM6673413.1 MFS transporter [Marseilla massiliensis]